MKKKIELILQHGWAFDGSAWETWTPYLNESPDYELTAVKPDRGYFGQRGDKPCFDHEDSLKIVIVHSFGLHLLPHDLFAETDLFVAISSFSSFHQEDRLSQKRSHRTIRLMQERLNQAPMEVIDQFYSSSYSPLLTSHALLKRGPSQDCDIDLLQADLAFMDQNILPLELLKQPKQLLFLHGSEDGIISADSSIKLHQSLPESSLVLFEGAGHALPFTHAAPCWLAIRQSLRSLHTVKSSP